ncbi:MAG: ABC transporter permease [Verrucomicrobia bacterium]|nr:ABC transporter permease [Verrucomicrobiota bacterium]
MPITLTRFFQHVTSWCWLFGNMLYWAFVSPFHGKKMRTNDLFRQMTLIGVRSLSIVFLVMFFMGLVLAMQSAETLEKVGGLSMVGGLVAAAVMREIGPMLTAIVLAGRCGAAITAELGTMRVAEELDALETMGLNPVHFLIVPRVLGMVIMAPCLTILGVFMAMYGGCLISVLFLDQDAYQYWRKSFELLKLKDIYSGMIKSVVFATLVSNIACYFGFIVDGGAEGVGKSTTQSVVTSIVMIIASDCVLTAFFYFV